MSLTSLGTLQMCSRQQERRCCSSDRLEVSYTALNRRETAEPCDVVGVLGDLDHRRGYLEYLSGHN